MVLFVWQILDLIIKIMKPFSTNMGFRIVSELNASFSVSLDDIAFDVGGGTETLNHDTVMSGCLDVILLNKGRALGVCT
jgi:hypothetical protein